jgi:hypothetical protein
MQTRRGDCLTSSKRSSVLRVQMVSEDKEQHFQASERRKPPIKKSCLSVRFVLGTWNPRWRGFYGPAPTPSANSASRRPDAEAKISAVPCYPIFSWFIN